MYYEIWPLGVSFDSTYFISAEKKFLPGDLILVNNEPFLVFSQNKTGKQISGNIDYYGNLFTPTTLYFQKFVANYWYSWYFRFFKLYVQDIKYIFKFSLPVIKRYKFDLEGTYISEYKNYDTYCGYLKLGDEDIKCIDFNKFTTSLLSDKQNLLVFPDDWTMFNFYKQYSVGEILDVNSTSLTRYKKFLQVKSGKIKTLLTTHGGVFQDWKNLKAIFVFFPYKWYYKNQQNPRYYLLEIAKQMKFFYQAKDLYFVM